MKSKYYSNQSLESGDLHEANNRYSLKPVSKFEDSKVTKYDQIIKKYVSKPTKTKGQSKKVRGEPNKIWSISKVARESKSASSKPLS